MPFIEGSRKRTHKSAGAPVDHVTADPDATPDPIVGVVGTAEGEADKGDLLVDTATGNLYVNTGTIDEPAWALVGDQSAS